MHGANVGDVISSAMSFDMREVLLRYEWKHNVAPNIAQRHAVELKRFLTLCALNSRAAYGIGDPIDTLWHEFILFSTEYTKFCDAIAGRYLHHKSRLPGRSRSVSEISKMYERFVSDYERVFKESPSGEYWNMEMECSHVEPE